MSRPNTLPQPPSPPHPLPSNEKVNIVLEPSKFDGTAKDFDAWIMSLKIYFVVHHKKFVDNKRCSLAVLAHMQGGTAGPWAKALLQVKLHATTPPDSVWFTWDQLKAELTAIFKDHTAGQKAQEKLENLRQGKHSIDELFSLFEMLTVECNLTSETETTHLSP